MVFHIERTVAAQLILPTHMFFAENIPPTYIFITPPNLESVGKKLGTLLNDLHLTIVAPSQAQPVGISFNWRF